MVSFDEKEQKKIGDSVMGYEDKTRQDGGREGKWNGQKKTPPRKKYEKGKMRSEFVASFL